MQPKPKFSQIFPGEHAPELPPPLPPPLKKFAPSEYTRTLPVSRKIPVTRLHLAPTRDLQQNGYWSWLWLHRNRKTAFFVGILLLVGCFSNRCLHRITYIKCWLWQAGKPKVCHTVNFILRGGTFEGSGGRFVQWKYSPIPTLLPLIYPVGQRCMIESLSSMSYFFVLGATLSFFFKIFQPYPPGSKVKLLAPKVDLTWKKKYKMFFNVPRVWRTLASCSPNLPQCFF